MDFLTSKRFVTTALVLMAILNVTLLGVLWWQNIFSKNFHSLEVRESYTRSISPDPDDGFSPAQKVQFRTLRREHFRKSMPEIRKIVVLKQQLIDEAVKTSPDTARIALIADQIGRQQATLDRGLAMHFHQLSNLCTPAQRDSLKAFLGKVYTRRYEHGSRWTREIRPADGPGPGRQQPPPYRQMP
jgi:hypothetical protein